MGNKSNWLVSDEVGTLVWLTGVLAQSDIITERELIIRNWGREMFIYWLSYPGPAIINQKKSISLSLLNRSGAPSPWLSPGLISFSIQYWNFSFNSFWQISTEQWVWKLFLSEQDDTLLVSLRPVPSTSECWSECLR